VSDAVIGFLGVIVGAAVAGAVSLLGEQFTTRREREARQALREQERKDTRDAFQRDAIIALHDAVTDFWVLAIEVNEQVRKALHPPREPIDQIDVRPILAPMRPASARVTAARAKIFDDELRRLVKEFDRRIIMVSIRTGQEGTDAYLDSYALLEQIEDRVNALLKELF
jgi:hypothetical protein